MNRSFYEYIKHLATLLNDLVQKSKRLLRYFEIMTSKVEKWIKAGYALLATDEIDGINIERLARALNVNKSGFYHYFGLEKNILRI